jgi:hypothetical protein
MKVQLHFLFSRNNKIGSKLISWSTQSLNQTQVPTPSHVAILVNKRWVFESTLTSGVRIISYNKWLTINEQIKCIPFYQSICYKELKNHFKNLKNKRYDYEGILYFAYRIILFKLFFMAIPEKNKFNKPSRYFCCEVIGKLLNKDFSMKAPTELVKVLSFGKRH